NAEESADDRDHAQQESERDVATETRDASVEQLGDLLRAPSTEDPTNARAALERFGNTTIGDPVLDPARCEARTPKQYAREGSEVDRSTRERVKRAHDVLGVMLVEKMLSGDQVNHVIETDRRRDHHADVPDGSRELRASDLRDQRHQAIDVVRAVTLLFDRS